MRMCFWPMLTAGVAAQKEYGAKYAIAGGDGVHPGWAGHTVMAYAFLKATRWSRTPSNTIYGAKRLIGRKYNSKVVQDIKHYFSYEIVEGPTGEAAVVLPDGQYALPEISASCSRTEAVAEATLASEMADAVISVPAYYNDNQSQAVKERGASPA